MRPAPLTAILVALACAAATASGCGGDDGATTPTAGDRTIAPTPDPADRPPAAALRPPPCPPVDNCARAAGEIAYVERVDPDGDGDAHFVLISRESITAPGISVIDVRAELRPQPLPGPGDQLAASGPIYVGSIGQRQIQADAIRFRRSG